MEVANIRAERRSSVGKHKVAKLRAEGFVPAVIYGEGQQPTSLTLVRNDLEAHLRHHHRVFDVEVEGERQPAYLQDVQWDCLTDAPLHVDFKRIRLDQEIEVEVELAFIGHPVGAGKGGSLVRDHQSITVRCLPTNVPESVEVNVLPLDIGQEILARDLPLAEGVTLVLDPETVVCHVVQATVAAAAPAEEAPAEEGETPPPEGDGGGD